MPTWLYSSLFRMAELVLTLNTFEFNGEYYKQVGGVAMSSRIEDASRIHW